MNHWWSDLEDDERHILGVFAVRSDSRGCVGFRPLRLSRTALRWIDGLARGGWLAAAGRRGAIRYVRLRLPPRRERL